MKKVCLVLSVCVLFILLGTVIMICGAAIASPIASIESVFIRVLIGIGLTITLIAAVLFTSRIMCLLAQKLRHM